MNVLLVEDDLELAATVQQELSEHRHATTWLRTAEGGLAELAKKSFDVCIFDVNLPGLDGFSAVEQLRQNGSQLPVLMLTARGTVEDRVKGLKLGADDYLTKPFAIAELLARLDALTRRVPKPVEPIRVGSLVIDPLRHLCTVEGGVVLDLSARQFALLELLARHRGHVVTRASVLTDVFGYSFLPAANIVDVHVSHLRHRLNGVASKITITTVRGVGYRLDQDPEP